MLKSWFLYASTLVRINQEYEYWHLSLTEITETRILVYLACMLNKHKRKWISKKRTNKKNKKQNKQAGAVISARFTAN